MDSLFLLQFGSFVVSCVLALLLVISWVHRSATTRIYEVSRFTLLVAVLLFACHYLVQMLFGLRQEGDSVGAVINILFYTPIAYLTSYSMINIACGNTHRRRYLLMSCISYFVILLVFFIGWKVYGSLHMPHALYVMSALFTLSTLFSVYDPAKEMRRMRQRLESDTAADLSTYDYFVRSGTVFLFILTIMAPVFIHYRVLLFVFGPLFFLSYFFFVVSFVCLGYKLKPVAQLTEGGFTRRLFRKQVEKEKTREELIAEWCEQRGFADPDLTLTTAALSIGIRTQSLQDYLQMQHGQTFRVWLSRIRIDAAKELLRDQPHYSNENVAAECGFTSRNYFQNLFKAETGYTPVEWQRLNANENENEDEKGLRNEE